MRAIIALPMGLVMKPIGILTPGALILIGVGAVSLTSPISTVTVGTVIGTPLADCDSATVANVSLRNGRSLAWVETSMALGTMTSSSSAVAHFDSPSVAWALPPSKVM